MNNNQRESLQKQLRRLNTNKQALEDSIARTKKELGELTKEEELGSNYVKVVCAVCKGEGVTYRMGVDNTDWLDDPCEDCCGEGFIYGRKFVDKRQYTEEELKYHQAFPI